MLDRGLHAPLTTSAGRLFDAAAALLGLRTRSSFEGQAAMDVEFCAEGEGLRAGAWPMPLVERAAGEPWQLDWAAVVTALLECGATGNRARAAARFHASLAEGIAAAAERVGIAAVVLTGGCFQNGRLRDATIAALERRHFTVFRHRILPPNDGGLAAGQALAALWGFSGVAIGAACLPEPEAVVPTKALSNA
jgi:hydrogenase maturation protein HypF